MFPPIIPCNDLYRYTHVQLDYSIGQLAIYISVS